jgi:hypothetical protein
MGEAMSTRMPLKAQEIAPGGVFQYLKPKMNGRVRVADYYCIYCPLALFVARGWKGKKYGNL